MKCRFVRDVDVDVTTLPASERELLSFRPSGKGRPPVPYFAKGVERETAAAAEHCLNGIAEPADDECAAAVGLTSEQLKVLQVKYERVAAGIHPDDFPLYDAGVIVGYNPDGSYKPGPQWDAYQKAQAEAESDDEEVE